MHKRMALGVLAALLVASTPSAAGECTKWNRLGEDEKPARVAEMIEGHLNSNVGKKFTSENIPNMRICLQRVASELRAQFDGVCAVRNPPMDAIDEIFDRYFLTCVQ